MTTDILVYARTRFVGFHRWPGATGAFYYLSHLHRHEFYVEVCVEVIHADRDVEFHLLRVDTEKTIKKLQQKTNTNTWSCETWANSIADALAKSTMQYKVAYVDVSEDGECGARVFYASEEDNETSVS